MGKRQLTLQERLEQARSHHGDKYDYSFWPPVVTANTKVWSYCPAHGLWEHKVINMCVGGKGCPKCGGTQAYTLDERKEQAGEKHNYKYDYSLWQEGIRATSRVDIICPEHGVFNQKLADHINCGARCPKCADTRVSRENRIKHARLVHGDTYDYSLLPEIVNYKTSYKIICKTHGVFEQSLNNHLKGEHGCPTCTKTGFNPSEPAYLYFLRSEEGLVKVGITKDYKFRIKRLRNKTPFKFDPLAVFYHELGSETFKIESIIKNANNSAKLTGFDGATEWLHLKDLDVLHFPELLGFKRVL